MANLIERAKNDITELIGRTPLVHIYTDEKTGAKTIGLCPKKEEAISSEELAGRIFLWDGCDSSACDKVSLMASASRWQRRRERGRA